PHVGGGEQLGKALGGKIALDIREQVRDGHGQTRRRKARGLVGFEVPWSPPPPARGHAFAGTSGQTYRFSTSGTCFSRIAARGRRRPPGARRSVFAPRGRRAWW